jgi:hypothetical protein
VSRGGRVIKRLCKEDELRYNKHIFQGIGRDGLDLCYKSKDDCKWYANKRLIHGGGF